MVFGEKIFLSVPAIFFSLRLDLGEKSDFSVTEVDDSVRKFRNFGCRVIVFFSNEKLGSGFFISGNTRFRSC